MVSEAQKNLNENTREVIERRRNGEKERIIKFVDRYNKQFIPLKFQFKEIEDYYAWNCEVSHIKLFVMIKSVSETKVVLNCRRSNKEGKKFTTVEIIEPPYADIYNTVYQFLVEAVKNSIELVELESKMKF